MTEELVQCQIRSQKGAMQTVWLPVRDDLKVGNSVTLKDSLDPEELWKLEFVGRQTLERQDLNKNRKWENDRFEKVVGSVSTNNMKKNFN